MTTKRPVDRSAKSPVDKPAETPSRWKIMRGDVEVESYASEEMARARFWSLSRSRAGDEGLKLLRPDGSAAD